MLYYYSGSLRQPFPAYQPEPAIGRTDDRRRVYRSGELCRQRRCTSASALVDFTITQATPTVRVAVTSGTYTGTAFVPRDTVTGERGSGGSSLEGVNLVLSYYSGTYTSLSQLTGLTPLSAARAPSACTPCSPASPAAPTTRRERTRRLCHLAGNTDRERGGRRRQLRRHGVSSDEHRRRGRRLGRVYSRGGGPIVGLLQRDLHQRLASYRRHTAFGRADGVGSYTALASFAGSIDYTSALGGRRFQRRLGRAHAERDRRRRRLQWITVRCDGDCRRNRRLRRAQPRGGQPFIDLLRRDLCEPGRAYRYQPAADGPEPGRPVHRGSRLRGQYRLFERTDWPTSRSARPCRKSRGVRLRRSSTAHRWDQPSSTPQPTSRERSPIPRPRVLMWTPELAGRSQRRSRPTIRSTMPRLHGTPRSPSCRPRRPLR